MRADLSFLSPSSGIGSRRSWLAFLLAGTVALACSGDGGDGGRGGSGGSGGTGGAGGTGGGSGSGGGFGGSGGGGGGSGGSGGATGGSGGAGGSGGGGGAGGGGAGGGTDARGGAGGAGDGSAGSGGSGGGGGQGGGGGGSDGGGGGDARADGGPGGPFALTSTAFAPGGIIMRKYRCQYENVSPPLAWTPGPPTTRSYAITMRSAGSPHWALWDIPADVSSLPEKIERLPMPPVPAGSKQCKPNVDGSTWYGYAGACPMGGTNTRPYYFEIHALRVPTLPGITADSPIRDVNAAIAANRVAMATLIGMAAPQSP